jgi:hydroxymethylpyrimidine pyrophosphatase-like HAD family hydrolase
VLTTHFPAVDLAQVVTIGDSPNDWSLFDPAVFANSVGVANIRRYLDQLPHLPRWITAATAGDGFCELVDRLLAARSSGS